MNKANRRNALNGTARSAALEQKPGTSRSAPVFATAGRKEDAETGEEAVHPVLPRQTIKGPFTPISRKNAVNPPLRAAKGDDDLMSQPPGKKS